MMLDWIESFVLRRADLVLPMGKFTKELALQKGANPSNTIVLPFPVRWADSATVIDFPTEPAVLFAGRLEREKGVQVLFEALKYVKETVPQVRLFIAGEGSYRQRLESLADFLGL